jgi:hypothetical protein
MSRGGSLLNNKITSNIVYTARRYNLKSPETTINGPADKLKKGIERGQAILACPVASIFILSGYPATYRSSGL